MDSHSFSYLFLSPPNPPRDSTRAGKRTRPAISLWGSNVPVVVPVSRSASLPSILLFYLFFSSTLPLAIEQPKFSIHHGLHLPTLSIRPPISFSLHTSGVLLVLTLHLTYPTRDSSKYTNHLPPASSRCRPRLAWFLRSRLRFQSCSDIIYLLQPSSLLDRRH